MLLPIQQPYPVAWDSRVWLSAKAHVPFSVSRLYVEDAAAGEFSITGLRILRQGSDKPTSIYPHPGEVPAALFSDRVYESPSFGTIVLNVGDELSIEVKNIGACSRRFAAVWQGKSPEADSEPRFLVRADLHRPFSGWADPSSWRAEGEVATTGLRLVQLLSHCESDGTQYAGIIQLERGDPSWVAALTSRPNTLIVLKSDEWDCVRDFIENIDYPVPETKGTPP